MDRSDSARLAAEYLTGNPRWEILDNPAAIDHADPSVRVIVVPVPLLSTRDGRADKTVSVVAYGSSEQIVRAFFLGADDYLADPWTVVELETRCRRMIRFDGIVVDDRGDTRVLGRSEAELWTLLQQHRGRVVDRETIMEVLHIPGGNGSRAADMAVNRLRKALGPLADRVETIYRRGYRLREG